jgi:hypothetical protein
MSRVRRRAIAAFVALGTLSICAATALAAPDIFTLEVSPSVGGESDTYVAKVNIEVSGISGPERYSHPEFDDFTILDTQIQQTTSMQIDPTAGRTLKTIEVRTYFLQPNKTGRLRIGPAKIRLNGQDFETRQLSVEVQAAGTTSSGPTMPTPRPTDPDPTIAGGVGVPGFESPDPRNREDMFLHVVADKRNVYEGEQVIVTWLLYTRSEILKFEPRPPGLDGLWSEKLYEPDNYFRYHEDVVGGVPYQVAIVSKRAVFPTRTGTLKIAPFEADVSGLYTPLGQGEKLESKSLSLEVQPLPDGAPPGFDPTYVGVFTIDALADRTQIDAGQSLTLTVTVRGEGAIRRTSAPKLDVPDFQFRAPRDFKEKVDTSSDRVRGERVYSYWATPGRGGAQEIPPITLSYFNPRTGQYDYAKSQPISIVVSGDPSKLDDDDASGRENVIGRDIRLQREGDTISSRTVPRMYRQWWFWLFAGFPLFGFAGVVVTDRVREGLRSDTPRSRLRRARGRAKKRFRVADIHLRGNRPAKFFGELARVIYEYIEERVGQPVQAMTRVELKAFLVGNGFADETVARIDEELEACDFARFAPSAAGPGEMKAALRRIQELLREIEKTRTDTQANAEGQEA